ncbi:hypothetical protein HK098_002646 [Nowakowskiella sp. JEL0407]|nr:hypothetical protein HK098_002646 [Nowakowskiella sp. JEL0407]
MPTGAIIAIIAFALGLLFVIILCVLCINNRETKKDSTTIPHINTSTTKFVPPATGINRPPTPQKDPVEYNGYVFHVADFPPANDTTVTQHQTEFAPSYQYNQYIPNDGMPSRKVLSQTQIVHCTSTAKDDNVINPEEDMREHPQIFNPTSGSDLQDMGPEDLKRSKSDSVLNQMQSQKNVKK